MVNNIKLAKVFSNIQKKENQKIAKVFFLQKYFQIFKKVLSNFY